MTSGGRLAQEPMQLSFCDSVLALQQVGGLVAVQDDAADDASRVLAAGTDLLEVEDQSTDQNGECNARADGVAAQRFGCCALRRNANPVKLLLCKMALRHLYHSQPNVLCDVSFATTFASCYLIKTHQTAGGNDDRGAVTGMVNTYFVKKHSQSRCAGKPEPAQAM